MGPTWGQHGPPTRAPPGLPVRAPRVKCNCFPRRALSGEPKSGPDVFHVGPTWAGNEGPEWAPNEGTTCQEQQIPQWTLVCLICHVSCPSLFLDYQFHVHDDQCGSNHFPTILTNDITPASEPVSRWKFSKANWQLFKSECNAKFIPGDFNNIEDPIHHFSSKLLEIAEECIPKTSASFKRSNPWFSKDCKKSVKERRAAVRNYSKHFKISKTYKRKLN